MNIFKTSAIFKYGRCSKDVNFVNAFTKLHSFAISLIQNFLFIYSPTLEDDDSRKRRRKKERSSLFFRKKKDKGVVGNNAASNGKAVPTIQHHPFFDPSQVLAHFIHSKSR